MPWLELKHLHIEHRWFIALLSANQMSEMINHAVRVMQTDNGSLSYKVAVLAGWSPWLVMAVLVSCALMVLPNMVQSIFDFDRWKNNRSIVRLAVAGLVVSALLWMITTYIASVRLGHGWLTFTYGQRAVVSMCFAAALAIGLNNARKRELKASQRYESLVV